MQRWYDSYRSKTEGRLRLGYPRRRQRREVLPGVHELLQMVCSELCSNRGPLDISDKEGCGMAVGALSTTCLSAVKRSFVRRASFSVP